MKVAQTVRIVSGEEIEQAWVYEAPYWIGVNRLPGSIKAAESVRRLPNVKEKSAILVERSEEVTIWTLR